MKYYCECIKKEIELRIKKYHRNYDAHFCASTLKFIWWEIKKFAESPIYKYELYKV